MFTKALQQLRKEARLTQERISEMLQVPLRTYGSWERGERQPDLETVVRIAECLGVTTDRLLGRTHTEVVVKQETPPPQSDDVVQLQFHLDDEVDESKLEKMVFDLVRKDFEKRGIEAAIRKVVNQEFEKRGL